jgi:hypothetical protein
MKPPIPSKWPCLSDHFLQFGKSDFFQVGANVKHPRGRLLLYSSRISLSTGFAALHLRAQMFIIERQLRTMFVALPTSSRQALVWDR